MRRTSRSRSGLHLSLEQLPRDERAPEGFVVGTYLHTAGAPPKLLVRGVVPGIDEFLELRREMAERSAQRGGCTLLALATFEDPGIVMDLSLLATDLCDGGVRVAHAPLGRIVRFAADYVMYGDDLEVEAVALLDAVLGTAPLIEPVDQVLALAGL